MRARIPRWLRWTALAAVLAVAGLLAWRAFQYRCAPPPIPPLAPPKG
ncbi:MAG: hypothetical protein IPK81_21160 [Rhodospirillales bacterium]|nr:MAG: hypothetical protein IPK81_21160 [Rhodospirillales bacterium]